jgi:ribonuclease PH
MTSTLEGEQMLSSLKDLKGAVTVPRHDGRLPDQLREVTFERCWLDHVPGSVLVTFGRTKVLCTVSVDYKVPRWMVGKGEGWLTAEYSMLPASTAQRKDRDISRGRLDGRSSEIQRLIGRSLRTVLDFKALGERTLWVDCDVLRADGGTRTAAITGAYVALVDALRDLQERKKIKSWPLSNSVQAVSVGVLENKTLLDLDFVEDNRADVDLNCVMTGSGDFIEIQGTGEKVTFPRSGLDELLNLAVKGCEMLAVFQEKALI